MTSSPTEPGVRARLAGGNMNSVFRDGDTVVRQAGPWTPTVHRYLTHLQVAGIDWIPSPIDIATDADGTPIRERLSYLDGEVPIYPLPDWVWHEDNLREGARRLRALHDASLGFASDGAVWQSPAKIPAEVVCHNDFSPHNLVYRDHRIVGAIDFDFCSPGPRIWDLGYFATRAVPLTEHPPANGPGMDQARPRVEAILDAYGDRHELRWDDILRVAILRLHDLARLSRQNAVGLANPSMLADAEGHDRDGHHLASLRR